MNQEMKIAMGKQFAETAVTAKRAISVLTRVTFAAAPAQVWKALVLYEGIGRRPPLHLRLLLPVPIGTDGRISEVGSEAMCFYEGGHFRKRITRIEHGNTFEFEVIEQTLFFGGGLRLSGGRYTLREVRDGETEVSVETCYRNTKSPRWFWQPLERMVCHSFHRHLLGSIQRKLESV